MPTQDESHLLYEDRGSAEFQCDDSSFVSALKWAAANRDIREFVALAHLKGPARSMLDYGCGDGKFTRAMKRCYPASTVWATDYQQSPPPALQGGGGAFYTSHKEIGSKGPFDFILCRHVMEHTYDPIEFVRGIHGLLSPDGVVMFEVPNLHAPLGKVFGKFWDNFYPPYHTIHFSSSSLRKVAVDAGLTPERFGSCEMPKIGRSLRKMFGCKYNLALFAVGVVLLPLQYIASLLTGQGTCLRLWARNVQIN